MSVSEEWIDLKTLLEGVGRPDMTDAEYERVARLVDARLPSMLRGWPVAVHAFFANACACDAMLEVIGVRAPQRPQYDPLQVGLALAEVGARLLAETLRSGGYAVPTRGDQQLLVTSIRKFAETLLASNRTPAAMRTALENFIGPAIRVVLGSPPAHAAHN